MSVARVVGHLEVLEGNPVDRRSAVERETLNLEAKEVALHVLDGSGDDLHLLQSNVEGVVVDTEDNGLRSPVEGRDTDGEPSILGLVVDPVIVDGNRMEHEAAVRVEDGEHVAAFFSGEWHHVPGFAIGECAGEVDFSSEHFGILSFMGFEVCLNNTLKNVFVNTLGVYRESVRSRLFLHSLRSLKIYRSQP